MSKNFVELRQNGEPFYLRKENIVALEYVGIYDNVKKTKVYVKDITMFDAMDADGSPEEIFKMIGDEEEQEEEPTVVFVNADIREKNVRDVFEDLTIRSQRCLINANIHTIGQLTHMTVSDLIRTNYFGNKALKEINDHLRGVGLSIGCDLPPVTETEAKA